MVNVFSRSTLCPPPSALGPGTWVYGASLALGRRVLASNPAVNLFHRGFVACDRYANGETAITQITCPVLFLLGGVDQMTPPKAARGLIDQARAAGKSVQVVTLPVGHHQMTRHRTKPWRRCVRSWPPDARPKTFIFVATYDHSTPGSGCFS
jgi:dienelactone hydrolase